MLKAYKAREMKALEGRAFENGVPSLLLMEHAAEAVADALTRIEGIRGKKALFICGKGNNGADSMAAARLAA